MEHWHELTISFPFDPEKEWDKEIAADVKDKVITYAKNKWKEAGRGSLGYFEETNEGST